jgi:nitroreductase
MQKQASPIVTSVRAIEAPVDPLFVSRWSPRSFDGRPVPDEVLRGLFEAARWAPSCYNDQPWLFVLATEQADRERFLAALVEFNRQWAAAAPALAFVFARGTFLHNGTANRWGQFDAGAAWVSLALQAHLSGLAVHGMGGFDVEQAHQACGVPTEGWTAMAGIAIGYPGKREALPEALREREQPSGRRPLASVLHRGRFRPEAPPK